MARSVVTIVSRAATARDWTDVERLQGRRVARSECALVARQGEVAVGCAILRPLTDDVVELNGFRVRPLALGSGAGLQILRAAMAVAASAGHRDLVVGHDSGDRSGG